MYDETSCSMNVKPRWRPSDAMLSGEPVMKLSTHTTSQSCSSRNRARWEPMNPAPPVIRMRIARRRSGGVGRTAADRIVREAETAHPLGLPEVTAVEDDGLAHHRAQALQVEELELVPLGDEDDG